MHAVILTHFVLNDPKFAFYDVPELLFFDLHAKTGGIRVYRLYYFPPKRKVVSNIIIHFRLFMFFVLFCLPKGLHPKAILILTLDSGNGLPWALSTRINNLS